MHLWGALYLRWNNVAIRQYNFHDCSPRNDLGYNHALAALLVIVWSQTLDSALDQPGGHLSRPLAPFGCLLG